VNNELLRISCGFLDSEPSRIGAPSIGFNIQLPREQEPNPYSTPELTFQFHSFTMRKMHLAMRAAGVVAFPGGFGTLAELFEVLTLVQTRKGRLIPLVCVDRNYWTQVINFDVLLDAGVISPADCGCCGSPTMRREPGKSWPAVSALRRCLLPSFEQRHACLDRAGVAPGAAAFL